MIYSALPKDNIYSRPGMGDEEYKLLADVLYGLDILDEDRHDAIKKMITGRHVEEIMMLPRWEMEELDDKFPEHALDLIEALQARVRESEGEE